MKSTIIFISLFFFTNLLSAQTLGHSMTSVSHDMRDGSFTGFDYNGYSAEVLHIEYLSDSTAQVFMSYAVHDTKMESFDISIDEQDGGSILRAPSFTQKTGIVSFIMNQKEINELVITVSVKSDLPWSMSEPFTLSTTKKPAVIVPISKD